jgi:hypothetical protein
MRVPGCSPASTGRERCPPFERRDLFPLPVSAVQRIGPIPASTASKSPAGADAWSTPQGFATPMAFGTGRSSRASLADKPPRLAESRAPLETAALCHNFPPLCASRSLVPARPAPYASDPVLVHRLVRLLHASFRPSVAGTPLRFATTSPPSGCRGDFHPQAVEHARHTKKKGSIPEDGAQSSISDLVSVYGMVQNPTTGLSPTSP